MYTNTGLPYIVQYKTQISKDMFFLFLGLLPELRANITETWCESKLFLEIPPDSLTRLNVCCWRVYGHDAVGRQR